MLQPDYNYRPDQGRALYLTEVFSEELAAKVLPRIHELRSRPEPVTVYINSRGGSLRVLDTIKGELQFRDAAGRRSRIITVSLGETASAAATLLVVGDYAIAHPHSVILFHGARFSDIDTMTMEHASGYATQLATLNHANAQEMARRSLSRVVRRYVQLLPEMNGENPGEEVGLVEFVDCITKRTSYSAYKVIERTMDRIRNAHNLSKKVLTRSRVVKADTQLKKDITIIKIMLEDEVRANKQNPEYRLDEDTMSDITTRFSLLREYQIGSQYGWLRTIIRSQGPALLSESEVSEYVKVSQGEDRSLITQWLYDKIGPILKTLWYYSLLLCRELQAGENRLTAADVYWLGCIDEVSGSGLHGERADVEVETPPSGDAPKGAS